MSFCIDLYFYESGLTVLFYIQNQAYGELYIDDGHSFDYKNGKYIHAKFQFTGSHFIKW